MKFIIRDTLIHEGYEDENLYLINRSVRYMQVGHREDAIKFCAYSSESEANQMAESLEGEKGREFVVERISA